MLRALLSIAFFAGFIIGGGSAFAQARPEKAQKPEAPQIAQVGTEHPAEVEPGDDRGAGEVGDDRGLEAELRGRAAEGEQEIENEAEHQHRGRDRNRERDRSGPDRGRDGDGGGHGRDGGGHGGRN